MGLGPSATEVLSLFLSNFGATGAGLGGATGGVGLGAGPDFWGKGDGSRSFPGPTGGRNAVAGSARSGLLPTGTLKPGCGANREILGMLTGPGPLGWRTFWGTGRRVIRLGRLLCGSLSSLAASCGFDRRRALILARTLSAVASSTELECDLCSLMPNSGSTLIISLDLTSSSLASSLMRIVLALRQSLVGRADRRRLQAGVRPTFRGFRFGGVAPSTRSTVPIHFNKALEFLRVELDDIVVVLVDR